MPRYIIHIGPPLTGARYIQTRLFHLRTYLENNGFVYPDVWPSSGKISHDYLKDALKTARDLKGDFDNLNDKEFGTVILSCEGLDGLKIAELTKLKEYIGDRTVQIVYYARRWSDRIPSNWRQRIMMGNFTTLPEFYIRFLSNPEGTGEINYSLVWEQFEKVFGRGSLKIVSFNNLVDRNVDIFEHFMQSIVGLPNFPKLAAGLVPDNVERDMVDTEIVRALNYLHYVETSRIDPAMRINFDRVKDKYDLQALRRYMKSDMSQFKLKDNAVPLRSTWEAVSAYKDRLVSPEYGKEIFERRDVEVKFVGQNYLSRDSGEVMALYRFIRSDAARSSEQSENTDTRPELGLDAANALLHAAEEGLFEKFAKAGKVLDVSLAKDEGPPVIPVARKIPVAIDHHDYCAFDDSHGYETVILSNVIECFDNPIAVLSAAYNQLNIGGYIIVVFGGRRDQFDKTLLAASKLPPGHKRPYSLDRLLLHIQAACGINAVRLRFAKDYENARTGDEEILAPVRGGYGTVVVFEKIGRNDRVRDVEVISVKRPGDVARLTEESITAWNVPSVLSHETGACDVRTVLILKLDHLGDFAMTVPNMIELRSLFPIAELSLVCGSWNAGFASSLGIFDRVFTCDYFKADEKLGRQPAETKVIEAQKLNAAFADKSFDLAVDFRVPSDSRGLLEQINARVRAGIGSVAEFPFLDIALPSMEAFFQEVRRVRESAEMAWNPTAFTYHSPHSVRDGVAVCNPLNGGVFITGPCVELAAGRYRGSLNLRLFGEHKVRHVPVQCEVATENGEVMFSTQFSVTAEAGQCEFDFDAPVDLAAVEFRLSVAEARQSPAFLFLGAKMTFLGTTPARRVLPVASIHISEHITLLLALIRSRLRGRVDPAEIRRRLAVAESGEPAACYVAVAPFSNSFLRDWPSDEYVQLCRAIVDQTTANIILLGSADQVHGIERLAQEIRNSVSDGQRVEMAIGLALSEVFNIISSAVTTITNNSGLAHVAAMLGAPAINIYSASHQAVEWGALGQQSVIVQAQVECGPCAYDTIQECLHGQRCLRIISHHDVMKVLERQAGHIFIAEASLGA